MTTGMTRWDTSDGLTFGRLIDDLLGRRNGGDADRMIAPLLDVTEDESGIVLTAELPGLKKEDVNVTVENGVLTISGEKKFEEEAKEKNWHRMERRYGSFYRAVTLPRGVDAEKAELTFQDGVLRIALPKREDVKPRTLKIK
jgi:HSP20 family protein